MGVSMDGWKDGWINECIDDGWMNIPIDVL